MQQQTTQKQMGAAEWCLLLALSVLWGGSYFFVAIAVKALPPFTIVNLRVGIAALVLLALARVLGLRLPKQRSVWLAFFGMGLLNNILPFCLIVTGQTRIPGGVAAILNAATPFFTVIVTHLFTQDEKMTGNKLAGVLIGFLGVVLMIGPSAFSGTAPASGHGMAIWGELAVIGAAISYAFAALFGRRFRRMGIPPLVTATGQVTASSLMLLPVTLLVDRPWLLPLPGLTTWSAIFGIALFSTALAYVLFFRILASAGATNIVLVTFLVPVSAILLGTLFLGEAFSARHVGGMALIALGLAAIDGRLLKRATARRTVAVR